MAVGPRYTSQFKVQWPITHQLIFQSVQQAAMAAPSPNAALVQAMRAAAAMAANCDKDDRPLCR